MGVGEYLYVIICMSILWVGPQDLCISHDALPELSIKNLTFPMVKPPYIYNRLCTNPYLYIYKRTYEKIYMHVFISKYIYIYIYTWSLLPNW